MTAVSQADASKIASAALIVNAAVPVLSRESDELELFRASGPSNLTPASVSITNTGAGSLTFTGVSDQPWLVLSAGCGTAPSTFGVTSSVQDSRQELIRGMSACRAVASRKL